MSSPVPPPSSEEGSPSHCGERVSRYGPSPVQIRASAPGRICLFGEHQDYLRLPVIAMAIDLRVTLTGWRRSDGKMRVCMPDISAERLFDPAEDVPYDGGKDFLAAAINVLRRDGVRWNHSFEVVVRSTIPINSGASSSSALQVAWIGFLLAAANDDRASDAEYIARKAYESEVVEFGAPGGMMDHYASALGYLIYMDCREPVCVQRLPASGAQFVLVNSGTPKDTHLTLSRVRRPVEAAFAGLGHTGDSIYDFVRKHSPEKLAPTAPVEADALVRATVSNFHLTQQARRELMKNEPNWERIGSLLTAHHEQLSGHLRISTPEIEGILHQGMTMGALGGKINGSGGGGSCFVLCDANAQSIASRISAEGYEAYVVREGKGFEVEVE